MNAKLFLTKSLIAGLFFTQSFVYGQYNTGDYRSASDGTWTTQSGVGTATWEKYNGATWSSSTKPTLATDKVYINKAITSSNNIAIGSLIFENGGSLTLVHTATINNDCIVKSGGKLLVNKALTLTATSHFNVEDNGLVEIAVNSPNIWSGTENFSALSNFDILGWSSNPLFPSESEITTNPVTGAKFGILTIRRVGAWNGILPTGTYKITDGDLVIKNTSSSNMTLNAAAGIDITVGKDLIADITGIKDVAMSSATGNNSFTVKGNLVRQGSGAGIFRMNGSGVLNLNVDGNVNVNEGKLRVGVNTSNGVFAYLNIKGNLNILPAASLDSVADTDGIVSFVGVGDGLTAATTQLADIANTADMSNTRFIVKAGAYLRLLNNDFLLGADSNFNVNTGGTLDFGYNSSNTALGINGNNNAGSTFKTEDGSYLKITSPDGISSTAGSNIGNIRGVAVPSISSLASFHYIGKANQMTGNAMGSAAAGRAIIVDMAAPTLTLTPSQSMVISNATHPNVNNAGGGVLDIRNGQFTETVNDFVSGGNNSGTLKMAAGTVYYIPRPSDTSGSDYIPSLSNLSLAGGEINLASTGNQTLRGGNALTYRDLKFSNGGIKTISSSVTNVDNVIIKDNTILDVSNHSFGKSSTNLTMLDTSIFKLGGSGVKPDMGGTYNLALQSTINFQGSSATDIRLAPQYAKIIVSGAKVSPGGGANGGVTFQPGGVFTVVAGGHFFVNNAQGFNGNVNSAIKSTNNPSIVLEDTSIVEYSRATMGNAMQVVSIVNPNNPVATRGYSELIMSGISKKTADVGELYVRDKLTVNASDFSVLSTVDTAVPNVLVANNGIINNAGIVTFENNAILMQDALAVNTGNVIVKRNANVPANQYNLWSSPVQSQDLYNLYGSAGAVAAGKVMEYIAKTDTFKPVIAGTTSSVGKGYSAAGLSSNAVTALFNGVPNNANQSISVLTNGSGYNLIGNPYPSNFNLNSFYTDNATSIDTAVNNNAYLWDNTNNTISGQQGSNYSGVNYAIYNFSTQAGVPAPRVAGTAQEKIPTSIIKQGQGFILKAKKATPTSTSATFNFNNGMRTTAGSAVYFKNGEDAKYWLEIETPKQLVISLLVSYNDDASDAFDKYDATVYNAAASDLFYTKSSDAKKLSIQGRKGSFNDNDTVLVGIKAFEVGDYSIKLAETKGLFNDSQDVYIKDNLLGKVVNLKDGDYHFTMSKGLDDTRFEIIYKSENVLAVNPATKDQFKVYRDGIYFVITSDKALGNVELYDSAGRLLTTKKTQEKQMRLDASVLANGVFVIKAENSGDIKTKKVIN